MVTIPIVVSALATVFKELENKGEVENQRQKLKSFRQRKNEISKKTSSKNLRKETNWHWNFCEKSPVDKSFFEFLWRMVVLIDMIMYKLLVLDKNTWYYITNHPVRDLEYADSIPCRGVTPLYKKGCSEYKTKLHLMMRHHMWKSRERGVHYHCYYSQVHSNPECL